LLPFFTSKGQINFYFVAQPHISKTVMVVLAQSTPICPILPISAGSANYPPTWGKQTPAVCAAGVENQEAVTGEQ
jgi:hypothetical protein